MIEIICGCGIVIGLACPVYAFVSIRREWGCRRGIALYHYPVGSTMTADGLRDNADIARELMQKTETGGVLTWNAEVDAV